MCQDMQKTKHELNGVLEPYYGFTKFDALSPAAKTCQIWLSRSQCSGDGSFKRLKVTSEYASPEAYGRGLGAQAPQGFLFCPLVI